jgi:hypothetical protein
MDRAAEVNDCLLVTSKEKMIIEGESNENLKNIPS